MPFLYQTRTIQQHAVPKKRWPVPELSALPKTPNDHIPFEQGKHELALEIPDAKTTITKKEKEIFKKLFALAEAEAKAEQGAEAAVVKESAKEPLSPKHQRIREASVEAQRLHPVGFDATKSQEQQAEQQRQFTAVKRLLESAKADVELWSTLETHVFQKIIQLDLDAEVGAVKANLAAEAEKKNLSKTAKKKKMKDTPAATQPTPARNAFSPNPELATLGTNYPLLLVVAMQQLRTSFPTSQLPFAIVPSIKRIGRSSYALGASTPLYNELISLTWRMYSDFTRIDELLQEMENGGLEFDEQTLNILVGIRVQGNDLRKGKFGANRKALWQMDVMQSGWRKVIAWIPVVREVLVAGAQREARGDEFEGVDFEGGV